MADALSNMFGIIVEGDLCRQTSENHSLDLREEDEEVDESSLKGVCQLLKRLERKQVVQFRDLQDLIEKVSSQVASFTPSPNASANHSTASAEAAVSTAAAKTGFDDTSKESKASGAAPSPRFSSTTPPAPAETAPRGSAILRVPQSGAVDATPASSNAPVETTNGGSLAAALPPPATCAALQNVTVEFVDAEERLVGMEPQESPIVNSQGAVSVKSASKDDLGVQMRYAKITGLTKMRQHIDFETPPVPRLKDYPGMKQWFSSFCRWLVKHQVFEIFISTTIVLNSVEVGMRIEFDIRGMDTIWFEAIETLFLVIYIFELLLRFMGSGWRIINNGWILFDLVIVCSGIAVLAMDAFSASNLKPAFIEHLLIFRLLRILRLIRALRLVRIMKVLGKLVNGLLSSMNAIFSTSFLVILFLYIFAVVGVEVMRQDDVLKSLEVVQTHFRSVPVAMLTLSQFVTQDSIASIYFPIVVERPLLGLFFFPLVFLLSIALMGLVAAYLLEAALDRAQTDKELCHRQLRCTLRKLEPDMRDAFRLIDANNNGVISREEVMEAYEHLPESLTHLMKADSLFELFEMLDEDDSGDVNEDEFVENLLATALSNVPLETIQMLKLLRIQRRRMGDVADQLRRLTEHMLPRDPRAMQVKKDLESGILML